MASPRLPSCFQPQSSFRDQTASTEAYSSLPPLPTRPSPNVPDTQSLPQIPTLSPELITPQPLSSLQQQALRSTKWPGRCQVVQDPQKTNVVWSLDGAHTTESVACCGTWWRDSIISKPAPHRILVFNCTSGRSGKALLQTLVDSLSPTMEKQILFTNVIISTNVTFSSGVSKGGGAHNSIASPPFSAYTNPHHLIRFDLRCNPTQYRYRPQCAERDCSGLAVNF